MERPHNEVILDSIADGVFTVDRDWNITSFNRAAERILGVDREQAIGQKCFDVFRADICQSACALRHTIETGEQLIDKRVNILDAEGRRIQVRISTAVLRDEGGEVVGGVETFRDLTAIELLRKEVRRQFTFADIVSKNHEIQRIFGILPDIAASDSSVLIEGPSGSGKELFARAIHDLSPRRKKPFVAVSCGALPGTLLESELFGYVRGAFTDAKRDKPGRFALAEGGTLLLDEVGELPLPLQVKLLRVLQERTYEPLGGTTPVRADVRIVAATNLRLKQQVAAGQFRDDLYYRLNVVRIDLPPLARRREDIPLLVEHFMERFNARMGKQIDEVSDEVLDLLMAYPFPGNIRELENAIEHAFILCHGRRIEREHLPRELLDHDPRRAEAAGGGSPDSARTPGRTDLAPDGQEDTSWGGPAGGHPPPRDARGTALSVIEQARAGAIREALARHGGDRQRAAASLGVHKTTLWRWMKRLGIK
ncbi:MAG: PAS domain-containing protein [Candidatus Eisenbacteria bacterium]|nr:PAS domain-containing protein [Candidatus Eisenbacteria bacterium]